MKTIYCVFDKKLGRYMPPMLFENDAEALRAVSSVVNSKQPSTISESPADFALYKAGTFDEETCTFENKNAICIFECSSFASVDEDSIKGIQKHIEKLVDRLEELEGRFGIEHK